MRERQSAQPRIPSARGRAAPVGPHLVEVLVEPDGVRGPDAQDQRARDPRLGLGPRTRPGVEGRPTRPRRLPPAGKVAVQVDSVRVLTVARGDAVRVQRRHEPEIGMRMRPRERCDDGRTGRFVAVDGPDDEDARSRAGNVHDLDRPVLHRLADDQSGG